MLEQKVKNLVNAYNELYEFNFEADEADEAWISLKAVIDNFLWRVDELKKAISELKPRQKKTRPLLAALKPLRQLKEFDVLFSQNIQTARNNNLKGDSFIGVIESSLQQFAEVSVKRSNFFNALLEQHKSSKTPLSWLNKLFNKHKGNQENAAVELFSRVAEREMGNLVEDIHEMDNLEFQDDDEEQQHQMEQFHNERQQHQMEQLHEEPQNQTEYGVVEEEKEKESAFKETDNIIDYTGNIHIIDSYNNDFQSHIGFDSIINIDEQLEDDPFKNIQNWPIDLPENPEPFIENLAKNIYTDIFGCIKNASDTDALMDIFRPGENNESSEVHKRNGLTEIPKTVKDILVKYKLDDVLAKDALIQQLKKYSELENEEFKEGIEDAIVNATKITFENKYAALEFDEKRQAQNFMKEVNQQIYSEISNITRSEQFDVSFGKLGKNISEKMKELSNDMKTQLHADKYVESFQDLYNVIIKKQEEALTKDEAIEKTGNWLKKYVRYSKRAQGRVETIVDALKSIKDTNNVKRCKQLINFITKLIEDFPKNLPNEPKIVLAAQKYFNAHPLTHKGQKLEIHLEEGRQTLPEFKAECKKTLKLISGRKIG